ncbi:hypothetical protein CGCTS75_v011421 [Colletotrichum tropicale]|nr:hypothetical protein CGCTS75_v011421 [Colletotrichum tropicale]
MKFLTLFSCIAAATAAATPRHGAEPVDSNLQTRELSCDVCVTTVKGSSTTIWGPFPFGYGSGGPTADNVYVGCNVDIDRRSATDCSQWRVSTSGSCGQVTKQQIC